MDIPAKRLNRKPTHPGAVLREDVVPTLGIDITTLAKHLGTTRQNLHRLMSEKTGISAEMALRLGKLCGNGYTVWLGMQQALDLYHAREKLGDKIQDIPTLINPVV